MLLAEKEKTQMTLATLVKDYAAYNLWANKRLVEWLQTKPAELIEQSVPSSFPSIKETLVHIWSTERFWLSVIQQTSLSIRQEFSGTVEEAFDTLLEKSEEFATYVESLTESELQEVCYLTTPWFEATRSKFEFIHHCMNHSTYHRGQAVTIGRSLGLRDAPMTDYNFYLLMPH